MQSFSVALRKPVVSRQTGQTLGKVEEGVVDPDTGKIIAFRIGEDWIPFSEVQEFEEERILIRSEKSLLPLEELPRAKQIKEKGPKVWRAHVYTENGKFLGKVADLIFEEHSGEILRYYVEVPFLLNPLKSHLVIPKEEVLRIERKGLIVKEPEKKVPAQALASQ